MTLLTADERRGLLRRYQWQYQPRVFIESGTADGATVGYLLEDFAELHTIETDPVLFKAAVERFRPYPHVRCWHGDSAEVLPFVLDRIDGPALVWLDAHWCEPGHNPDGMDTPIREELGVLFADGRRHVILIDDARCFREGEAWESERYDWPALSWVQTQAETHGYGYRLTDDVIRLVPA